ncbi:MAG TPA: transposase [Candidatus Competibacteraceae bacterium]|nr:transposase [Candidatus Competibacteraceae bacterium]
MQLRDFARRLPNEVWDLFEPLLPSRLWCGNGRPPKSNRDCFHALMYVLVSGIPWELLPAGFPSAKTGQRRLKRWLALDVFHQAWHQLAARYQALQGINWDQVLLDGSKKPAKKGANRPGLHRSIGVSVARLCNSPLMAVPCRWEWL